MYKFSQRSINNLKDVDSRLVKLCQSVLDEFDFVVIEGHRSLEKQMKCFEKGTSQIDGITKKSKHNYFPSLAIDCIPYKKGHNPFDGSKESDKMFDDMAKVFKRKARELNLELVWGGDWKTLVDKPHFELIIKYGVIK